MCETTVDPELAAATAEANAVGALHDLNAHYIPVFIQSDTLWYGEHLSDDFNCTLADGHRIDKTEFLHRNAEGPVISEASSVSG